MAASVLTVLGEALVVAIALFVLATVLHMAHMRYDPKMSMEHSGLALQVLTAGFLFHVIAEYSGVNATYCEYFPLSRE